MSEKLFGFLLRTHIDALQQIIDICGLELLPGVDGAANDRELWMHRIGVLQDNLTPLQNLRQESEHE